MLKRSKQSESSPRKGGPTRILIVDDQPDSARLIGAVLRREGYEVAEVGDHQLALMTLVNEPVPIDGVIASFSAAGGSAALKLLDAVRHHPDTQLSLTRVLLILESPKLHIYSYQSGADEVVLRPVHANDLIHAVKALVQRSEAERAVNRRRMIEFLSQSLAANTPVDDGMSVARFS